MSNESFLVDTLGTPITVLAYRPILDHGPYVKGERSEAFIKQGGTTLDRRPWTSNLV